VRASLIQAEYGNQLDAIVNGLDWTLAREVLLADVRRLLGNLLLHVDDVWTQVPDSHLAGRVSFIRHFLKKILKYADC